MRMQAKICTSFCTKTHWGPVNGCQRREFGEMAQARNSLMAECAVMTMSVPKSQVLQITTGRHRMTPHEMK